METRKLKCVNGTTNIHVPEEEIPTLVVGVETEAPLIVTKWDNNTQLDELQLDQSALVELASLFNSVGLKAYYDAVDAERDHSQWGITMDPSIDVGFGLQGLGVPVEIKSPPMSVDNTSGYEAKFYTMWNIIWPFKIIDIESWKMASTHIHFSLKNMSYFPMEFAQKLAFCIVYFEKPISEMMPAMTDTSDTKRPGGWRYCTRYARRNRVRPVSNDRVPVHDLRTCWESIRATRTMKELFYLMCYDDDSYRRVHDMEMKYWRWNFKGLNYRTIEFRQMPPARSAPETLDWITFTSKFVEAAGRLPKRRLDMAAEGQASFTEAFGFPMEYLREEMQSLEAWWAAGRTPCPLNHDHLRAFMGFKPDDEYWGRMIKMRDRIEWELAQLSSN